MKVLEMEENSGSSAGEDLSDIFQLCERLPLLVPILYGTRWRFRVRLGVSQFLILVPMGKTYRIGLDTVNEDHALPHTLSATDIFEILKFELSYPQDREFVVSAIRHLQQAAQRLKRQQAAVPVAA